MSLIQDDILPLQDLHFNEKYALYHLQYNHYHYFVEDTLLKELKENPNIFYESESGDTLYKYRFEFEDISIKPPTIPNSDEYMFPEHARQKNLTYSSKLIATVKQIQDEINMNTGEIKSRIIGDIENEIPIAGIPIMVRSNYCTTNIRKDIKNTECDYDPGCYFIVKGNEKVVLGMERMIDNKVLCFVKKDATFENKIQYYTTINSKKRDYTEMIQTLNVKMKKDKSIIVETPHFNDVPLFVMLRALGMNTDQDIVDHITTDPLDSAMKNILRISLNQVFQDQLKPESEDNLKIKDQDNAIKFLTTKMKKYNKKYTDTDDEKREIQKLIFVRKILHNDVLPHQGTSLIEKAYFICLMTQKLLNTYLQRRPIDDRDSYVNKRVDMPGTLLGQLFRQLYKKMLVDIKKFFDKKYSGDDVNPINVINQIKPSTIEQGMINGLATGTWGLNKTRKGVSQALQRYSYLQTISYFRRIVTPSIDSTTQKVTSIRHVKGNQAFYLDSVETPEGGKVGLQKHLSLMTTITMPMASQEIIVNELLESKLININSIHPYELNNYVKVYVNGVWKGLIEDGIELALFLRDKRENNFIDRHVSIIYNIKNNELIIYTDGGRFIRPLLKVQYNKLLLSKQMIQEIDLTGDIPNKINRWNEFLMKYPHVIEYIDIEESETIMISMYLKELDKNRRKMNKIIKKPNSVGDPINRYNDTLYVNYSHSEFHPSMMLGSMSSCIPFANHNQAPRNIYNFSHAKQGKGLFATNERHRIDISYRLANPERPLVNTRCMRYVKAIDMPNGENIVVAIACYTGYNQEDSVVINQSAIDRGLFRSYVMKKYLDEIKKNPSTSQDDKFMKPDPNRVSGMKKVNYDKLNSKGDVDVDNYIESGDVIIGKVSPIQPGADSTKIYKDTSTIYKGVSGHVDKVYTGIYNNDGYEMYAMQVRSERIPRVGDKVACYSKDHEILTDKGWLSFDNLTYDHKVATLVDGETLEYNKPTEIMSYDYKGKMYHIKSNQIDLTVTPNHRMYVGNSHRSNFQILNAEDIYGKTKSYKKNVVYGLRNNDCEFILPGCDDLSNLNLDMNAWLEFFGIWIAEGCTIRDWGITFATHKQRVKDKLEEVCAMLGFEIRKHKDKTDDNIKNAWCFNDKRLVSYFKLLSVGAVNKSLPEWCFKLNMEQTRLLINGMMLGDGHTMKNGTRRYDTSSTKLANDFQRLCLHAGWSCNIMIKYKAGHESYCAPRDEIFKSTTDAYRMTIITSQNTPIVNKNIKSGDQHDSWIDYDNKVYCCTAPSGIIYVRNSESKIVSWSGNSRHGQKGTCGITLTTADMPFSESNIVPDLIINPNCIPSRMTIAQLLECVLGKSSALKGQLSDATPFNNNNIQEAMDVLKEYGFEEHGFEDLYCGMTGKKIKSQIFIGPTYYMRVKHLVEDKIHSRSKGPRLILTRQPPEGKSPEEAQ